MIALIISIITVAALIGRFCYVVGRERGRIEALKLTKGI